MGKDFSIRVERKAVSDISDATLDTSGAVGVSVTVSSDGKSITTFGGGRLTVDIPVGGDFIAGENYRAVIISTGGKKDYASGMCIAKDGALFVEVETTHLSTFIATKEKALAFTDVAPGAWYYSAVTSSVKNGLFTGCSGTAFAPENTMTRAMLVSVLYKLEGTPDTASALRFVDVNGECWYAPAIAWAAAKGIVSGYGTASFGPNDTVTREQLAVILCRYAKSKGLNKSTNTDFLCYSDAAGISDYAVPAMRWACGAGLIAGNGKSLMPCAGATRAQAATILTRFCNSIIR